MRDDPLHLCGQQLNGRYLVERAIGEGGMGVVYAAVRFADQTPCALKLIRPEMGHLAPALADEILRRFRREAKLGVHVQHEGLVQVFDLDQLPDGTLFYAMELLAGRSLCDVLSRGGPFPWPEAVEACAQAADALCALHGAQLVHRDIKPANLQLLPDGRIKVLDLGVAHVSAVLSSDADEPTDVRTRTGAYLGTPAYMAPEQLEDSCRVDGRADVYALALLLFELCCGAQPFLGLRLEEVLQMKFLRRPVPPLRQHCSAAPAALERLLSSALGSKEGRPEMAAFGAALVQLIAGERQALREQLGERLQGATQAPLWAASTLPAPPPVQALQKRPIAPRALVLAAALFAGAAFLWHGRKQAPMARPGVAAAPLSVAKAPPSRPAATAAAAPEPAPRPEEEPKRGRSLEPGRLRIAVRPFADIFIDGAHRAEGSPHTYTLPPGRHRIRAINTALGKDEVRTVQVPSRGQADVHIDWGPP